jgi:hypothetical protein
MVAFIGLTGQKIEANCVWYFRAFAQRIWLNSNPIFRCE